MDMKVYVWGGMFAGSGIGSLLPSLWGDASMFTAIVLTSVGGVLGIWAGYQLGKHLGV